MDLASVARTNAASFARLIGSAPGGRVVEERGVRATLCSAAPERPLLNSVFPSSVEALAAAYDGLEEAYRSAGVRAFTVWLLEGDAPGAAALAERGHVLDGMPRAMAAPCSAIERLPPVLRPVDDPPVAEIAALNDAAYGYPGSFARAVGPDLANHAFLAGELDGDSLVACTVGVHLGDDVHVTMTATRPDHRGRGIASSLVGRVVAAGEAAGATTTSLVATTAGVPVYARLGYRDVGAFEMWERVL